MTEVAGCPIARPERRLRLQRAALDLLEDKLSIERTARRAGFASQAAFTRAFRAESSEPPARYRGALTDERIAGGRYARIVHTGPYAELPVAYDWLYQTWLPTSGEEPRDPPTIEEYLNDARLVAPKDLQTAIMMPLAEPA